MAELGKNLNSKLDWGKSALNGIEEVQQKHLKRLDLLILIIQASPLCTITTLLDQNIGSPEKSCLCDVEYCRSFFSSKMDIPS